MQESMPNGTVGANCVRPWEMQVSSADIHINFGRDVVLSAYLCYNRSNKSHSPKGSVASSNASHKCDGRSLRDFRFVLTSL